MLKMFFRFTSKPPKWLGLQNLRRSKRLTWLNHIDVDARTILHGLRSIYRLAQRPIDQRVFAESLVKLNLAPITIKAPTFNHTRIVEIQPTNLDWSLFNTTQPPTSY